MVAGRKAPAHSQRDTEAADATDTTRIIGPDGVDVATVAGAALSWSRDGSALAIRADSGLELTLMTLR